RKVFRRESMRWRTTVDQRRRHTIGETELGLERRARILRLHNLVARPVCLDLNRLHMLDGRFPTPSLTRAHIVRNVNRTVRMTTTTPHLVAVLRDLPEFAEPIGNTRFVEGRAL